jgi:hypothetical protein
MKWNGYKLKIEPDYKCYDYTALDPSEIEKTLDFNTGYLGGQRLILNEILGLTRAGERILVLCSAGHELPYYLSKYGRKVTSVDFSPLSDLIYRTIKSGDKKALLEICRDIQVANLEAGDLKEFHVNTISNVNYEHFKCNIFDIEEYVGLADIDCCYFGTPTVMQGRREFYRNYDEINFKLDPSWKPDADHVTKEDEMKRVDRLLHLLSEAEVSRVITGVGSGVVPSTLREYLLSKYYERIEYICKKKFYGFADIIISAEELKLKK